MRHIRNFFAHYRGNISFDDKDVVALCDQLKWIDSYPWGGLAGEKPLTTRGRYVATVIHIFPFLTVGVGKPIGYSTSLYPFSEMYA